MVDDALIAGIFEGRAAAVARAASIIENRSNGVDALLAALEPRLGRARRIGLTGPPGAGKSTLAAGLTTALRARALRVAVLAVDPTSPFTGGALLGDRIRLERVALDPGVFIRSMATRGSLGGLAAASRDVCDLLDAAGFDCIVVETVGVGQSELDVASMVDQVILVLVPESGDGIQALKSGVMEAADIIVINKADRPGAEPLRRDIEMALDLRTGPMERRRATTDLWRSPVVLTTALNGTGVPGVLDRLDQHWNWLAEGDGLRLRRRQRLTNRVRDLVDRAMQRWTWTTRGGAAQLAQALAGLEAAELTAITTAARIVAAVQGSAAGEQAPRTDPSLR
jgi:LAO/AO transport system kinase